MFGLEWQPFKITWGDAAAWVQAVHRGDRCSDMDIP